MEISFPAKHYVEFFFEFVLNSDNTQAVTVETNAYSLDVDGNNNDLREYVVISSFGAYTLANPTQLNFIPPSRFESSTDLVNEGVNANSQWLAKTDYAAISTFTYRAGVLRDGTAEVLDRLFALAFEPIVIDNPVVTQLPVLTINKTSTTSSGTVVSGDTITYTIEVENDASASVNATNVVVSDVLPAGVIYVSGSAQKTYPAASTGSFSQDMGTDTFDTAGLTQTFTVNATHVPAGATLTSYGFTTAELANDWLSDIALTATYPGGTAFSLNAGDFGGNALGSWNIVRGPGTFAGAAEGVYNPPR